MRVSGKGKGSKQEWGVSNAVVAAIYSAGRQAATTSQARKPLPAPIFHMHFLMMNDSWGDSVTLQGWNHRKGKK